MLTFFAAEASIASIKAMVLTTTTTKAQHHVTTPAASASSFPVAAIGGAIGGVIAIVALLILIVLLRRNRKPVHPAEKTPGQVFANGSKSQLSNMLRPPVDPNNGSFSNPNFGGSNPFEGRQHQVNPAFSDSTMDSESEWNAASAALQNPSAFGAPPVPTSDRPSMTGRSLPAVPGAPKPYNMPLPPIPGRSYENAPLPPLPGQSMYEDEVIQTAPYSPGVSTMNMRALPLPPLPTEAASTGRSASYTSTVSSPQPPVALELSGPHLPAIFAESR